METIQVLLKKLEDLNNQEQKTAIDIDLMLQHTRNLYDQLLEQRTQPLSIPAVAAPTEPEESAQESTETEPVTNIYTAPPIELNVPEEEPLAGKQETLPETLHEEATPTNVYTAPIIELNTPEEEPTVVAEEIQPEEKTQSVLQPIFFNDAPQTGKDIRKSIGINDKYQIMSELFGNNKENYELVMGELNSFDTFPEAQTWLKAHLADAPGWDEENYTVQLLYGLMQRFFAENRPA